MGSTREAQEARGWQRLRHPGRKLLLVLLFPAVATWAVAADPCLECHALPNLGVDGRPLWMHEEGFASSLHGELACTDCHKGLTGFPHPPDHRVRCDLRCHVPGATHEPISVRVQESVHAALGDPPCLGCHTTAGGLEEAPVTELCRSCHRGLDPTRTRYPDTLGAFGARAHSRIGEVRKAPDCVDCHGVHDVGAGTAARGSCDAGGCHPRAREDFGVLFDHAGTTDRTAEAGGLPAAALAVAGVAVLLLLHALRGDG